MRTKRSKVLGRCYNCTGSGCPSHRGVESFACLWGARGARLRFPLPRPTSGLCVTAGHASSAPTSLSLGWLTATSQPIHCSRARPHCPPISLLALLTTCRAVTRLEMHIYVVGVRPHPGVVLNTFFSHQRATALGEKKGGLSWCASSGRLGAAGNRDRGARTMPLLHARAPDRPACPLVSVRAVTGVGG